MSNDTVPAAIQDRLEALEARRREIISENAADRTGAEYAVARIAERKAEKIRLKIEARALRMAVDAYASRAVEVEDFGASECFKQERIAVDESDEPPAVVEVVDLPEMPDITEVERSVIRKPPLAARILLRLKEADGPLTRRDIASSIGEDPDQVSTQLSHMKRRKLVAPVEGQGWTIP